MQAKKLDSSQSFKNTNIIISFTTKNNTGKLLSKQNNSQQNKYDRSGVHQLKFQDCGRKYIGQKGRPFHVIIKEHFRDYKYKNNKSNFVKHLLENRHSFNSIENSMDILHTTSNGKMLNSMEIFYIYRETKNNSQMNDRPIKAPNIIFDIILLKDNDGTLKAK